MLIELDGSAVNDAIQAGNSRAVSRDCIENLLLAHHHGKHVVFIEQEHVEALSQLADHLSIRARGALQRIRFQRSEIRGLRDRVRWILRIGLGPAFNGDSQKIGGKEIIQAPLHAFHDQERLGRAVLLGENLTDAALYLAMGKAFIAGHGWGAQLALARQGGGGDTTASCFKELVSDGRIVLAIVDSDKRHPKDEIGGTAAKVVPIPRTALQHVHVLHVRFAENLLSSAIYQEAFATQKQKLASLTRLKQAETLACTVPWRDHADLKRGLKLYQVGTMAPGSPEATFWSRAATELQRDQCQQTRTAPCGKIDECECYVTDALGRDALELVVAWMDPRDPRRNARLLGLARNTPLGDLCEKVLAWGIALGARPT